MEKSWIRLNNQILNENNDLNLEKDKEAVKAFFLEDVNKKTIFFYTTQERLNYLIDNGYYVDFRKMYTWNEIEELYSALLSEKFRFKSYMAAFKFFKSYALKDKDKKVYLERYEDRIAAISLYLGQGNINRAKAYAGIMIHQEYQPATPTFLNAGLQNAGKLVSCNLLEVNDTMNDIGYIINSCLKLSANGAGVAINMSKLRARHDPIKERADAASGIVPVMKQIEDAFAYANQGGARDGAGAVYLNIFHNDIIEFLDSKKVNADEKIRIKNLSIGVVIPDKFMELAENDDPYYSFSPYDVKKETGIFLDDLNMSEWYDKLLANPNIRKRKGNARELITKIAQVQIESGYPYLMFIDNTNKAHALNGIGKVRMSNLCTEITQLSTPSDISDDRKSDNYGYGISCVLGSLNIANVMERKSIHEVVSTAVEQLSTVSDLTAYPFCEDINKANNDFHSIGIGAMNLHGFFAKNKIMYESTEALDFCNVFFMTMNYASIKASMEVAMGKGKSFEGFEQSDYYSGRYFDKYTSQSYLPVTDKIKHLFEGVFIPTPQDWANLAKEVKANGMYNAYRLAIAPNQSSGYINNATPSVVPITDIVEVREYGDSTTYYPMPYLSKENFFFYKSAYDMDQINVIKLISVIQRHIDQGISCILHVNGSDSTRRLAQYYIAAWKLGLKTLYYTRTRKTELADCVACAV